MGNDLLLDAASSACEELSGTQSYMQTPYKARLLLLLKMSSLIFYLTVHSHYQISRGLRHSSDILFTLIGS